MRSAVPVFDARAALDVSTPSRRFRLPGVAMAGFRSRVPGAFEMRVVPYPAVTVFFDFGDALLTEDAGGRVHRGGIITGLAPGGVLRGRGRDIECLQVRLSPVLARAVLGEVPGAGGTAVAFDDLWGPGAERLRDLLAAARTWDERFAIAETALGRRAEAAVARVAPEAGYAWRQLVLHGGDVRVEAVADDTGWSRKRLWSVFRAQLGVTPKGAARLVRFDRAAHRLAAGENPAAVAAEAGYADQSHLNRDVMAFAGITPAEIAAAPWLAVDPVAWAAPDYLSRTA